MRIAMLSVILVLAACSRPMPGGDRDAHGCLPSGGYSWCERSQQCERPWELAEREGFPNEPGQFERWCSAAPEPIREPAAG